MRSKGNSEKVIFDRITIGLRFATDILGISDVSTLVSLVVVPSEVVVLLVSDSVVVISGGTEFMVVGSTLVITEIIL
jgi:hypothetical protein